MCVHTAIFVDFVESKIIHLRKLLRVVTINVVEPSGDHEKSTLLRGCKRVQATLQCHRQQSDPIAAQKIFIQSTAAPAESEVLDQKKLPLCKTGWLVTFGTGTYDMELKNRNQKLNAQTNETGLVSTKRVFRCAKAKRFLQFISEVAIER